MTTPPFEIVVPFHSGSSPIRARNLGVVLARLDAAGWEELVQICGVPGGSAWSPGAARNRGARLASAPVLVFNDADTVCPPAQLLAAIELAQDPSTTLAYAYTLYVRLRDGELPETMGDPERTIIGAPSMGCAAIRRDVFDRLGGFDEGYRGWGYEDLDFAARAAELGQVRRVDGAAYHLWHGGRRGDDAPDDAEPELVAANYRRYVESRPFR